MKNMKKVLFIINFLIINTVNTIPPSIHDAKKKLTVAGFNIINKKNPQEHTSNLENILETAVECNFIHVVVAILRHAKTQNYSLSKKWNLEKWIKKLYSLRA